MGFLENIVGGGRIKDPAEMLTGALLTSVFGGEAQIAYEPEVIKVEDGRKTKPDFAMVFAEPQMGALTCQVIMEVTKSPLCSGSDPKARQRRVLERHAEEHPEVAVAVLYRENLATPNAQLGSMMVVGALARGEVTTGQARAEIVEIAEAYAADTPDSSTEIPWQTMISEIAKGWGG